MAALAAAASTDGHPMTRVAAVTLSALLLVSACRGYGDPIHAEHVINNADSAFVVRYEESGLGGSSWTVEAPAHSSGAGQLADGDSWSGTVVVMTGDCRVLGRVEVSAKLAPVIIAADGTLSLVTEGINGRPDINFGHVFEATTDCPT